MFTCVKQIQHNDELEEPERVRSVISRRNVIRGQYEKKREKATRHGIIDLQLVLQLSQPVLNGNRQALLFFGVSVPVSILLFFDLALDVVLIVDEEQRRLFVHYH